MTRFSFPGNWKHLGPRTFLSHLVHPHGDSSSFSYVKKLEIVNNSKLFEENISRVRNIA